MKELVIRPKFLVGETVYYMWFNKVASGKIYIIEATIGQTTTYNYKLEGLNMALKDEAIFASKQDLLDSL